MENRGTSRFWSGVTESRADDEAIVQGVAVGKAPYGRLEAEAWNIGRSGGRLDPAPPDLARARRNRLSVPPGRERSSRSRIPGASGATATPLGGPEPFDAIRQILYTRSRRI